MADGAVQFLLDKLTTILYQQASLLGDAKKEIIEIKLELESMKSFLGDAERRKDMSESVETWVRQVREVANEVEDLVDEFMYYEDIRRDRKGMKHFFQDIIDGPKHISSRRQISSKLKKIREKVCEVSERSKRYAFDKSVDEGRSRKPPIDWWQYHGESSIFDVADEIVGMEDDKAKLLVWLTGVDPRRTVISIVGMGGLGKTTLVTKVYNELVIKDFDCWAWISVSQTNEYEVEDLLRGMIKEFLKTKQVMIPSNLGSMNYRQLVEMLIDILRHKRYFVVLDDVWSIVLWSRIRGAFPDNGCRSRVLFTTRNENVANSVGPGSHVLRLKPLKEDDAWSLFCKKAFWTNPDRSCPSELELSARFIMKKCEGLPLALVAIGGLMCSRNKLAVEWNKVCYSLNWQLNNNPMLERVKGILLLSFNDLPFNLKHCFLYCCVFRYGYPIKRKKLIRLWIAEGFVLEQKGMTVEEVAEDYLAELIYRSMIHVIETNDAGRVKTFRMHDVMRELAVTTSQKENLCAEYDGRDSKLEEKIQRLSVYNRGENIPLKKNISHHLRSLFVFQTDTCSAYSLNRMSSYFRLLRVLDLEGVYIETVPSTLVNLFNLRYLNLRETKVTELPKSMEMLRNLQTLDLRNTGVEKLPKHISSMQKLRHLFFCCNKNHNSDSPHFSNGLSVPPGIGNIRGLQTLTCVEADEQLIQQLGNLTGLRRLDITRLRASDGQKLCNSIQKMTSLCRLSIIASEVQELLLDNLTIPPLFLQKLTLIGLINTLPPWFQLLDSLTHLHLGSCHIKQNILSSLQTLPALAFLELDKAYEGSLMHFQKHGFPKLCKLKLRELVALKNVKLEEGTLRSIKELYLINCSKLKVLPQGIENLTSLQKLNLEAMPDEIVQRLDSDLAEKHCSKNMAPAAATDGSDSIKPRDVCIVGAARTPMGGFLGTLSSLSATKLGSIAIQSALKRANIDPALVQEVFFGNVLSANLGQAPARQAALGAGLPNSVVCTTVNKVCASGMKATILAAQSIQLGINDIVVAGGMESMSNVPKYIADARKGSRFGHDSIVDGMLKDGLWDVYNDFAMGSAAEICAEQHGLSREDQDNFAIQSFERGIAAQNEGAFTWEIAPVEVPGGRGKPSTIVDKDEGLGKFDAAKLRKLRPSFKENGGTVTAGNASSISDGGAALVLVSGETVIKLGLEVIAKISGYGDAAQAPELFTTSPALAIPKAISSAGIEASQVDFYEINEAFAVVALANQKLLGLDPAKVNIHGGAVSLGHPLGCSGARILVTLLGVLKKKSATYGVAGVCNGGGGASALVLELV